jgi:hypothetical protein
MLRGEGRAEVERLRLTVTQSKELDFETWRKKGPSLQVFELNPKFIK